MGISWRSHGVKRFFLDFLSIYLSTYLSIYLSLYRTPQIGGSAAPDMKFEAALAAAQRAASSAEVRDAWVLNRDCYGEKDEDFIGTS